MAIPQASVSFPVEAHVRKFLIRSFGSAHVATKNTLLGMLVLHSLDNTYAKMDKEISDHFRYTVLVPEYYLNKCGHTLPRNTQHHLSEVCTRIFNMSLFEHLDLIAFEGKKVYPALRSFLKRYNITEDDMKVESLYKAYQRHCERKEIMYPATK